MIVCAVEDFRWLSASKLKNAADILQDNLDELNRKTCS